MWSAENLRKTDLPWGILKVAGWLHAHPALPLPPPVSILLSVLKVFGLANCQNSMSQFLLSVSVSSHYFTFPGKLRLITHPWQKIHTEARTFHSETHTVLVPRVVWFAVGWKTLQHLSLLHAQALNPGWGSVCTDTPGEKSHTELCLGRQAYQADRVWRHLPYLAL